MITRAWVKCGHHSSMKKLEATGKDECRRRWINMLSCKVKSQEEKASLRGENPKAFPDEG